MEGIKSDTLTRVQKLFDLFHQGQIPTLAQHEVNPNLAPNSRENYIYFTLPPCLNFQRSSPAMWASALQTYQDPETNYLFFPEKVVKSSRDQVQKDLLKHKLSLQLNKHTDIWMRISETFHELYKNDPRELLIAHNWDVIEILNVIQKQQNKLFPYLSGPKMANYWLYILTQYTDAKFTNMQAISIIPDTHVLQCSVHLGLVTPQAGPLEVSAAWQNLLAESNLTPVQMHPVLWNWSRNHFQPSV